MDAQGLSIKFIVLLAVGILVLVLLVLFIYIGYSPNKNVISKQNAINSCKELCIEDENIVMGRKGTIGALDYPLGYKFKFCKPTFNIQGMGSVKCDQLYTCTLQDADGDVCTLNCTANGGGCQ